MLLGILGKAKSGKDTIADYLCKELQFVKVSLADPLKRYCAEVYQFSYEQLWGPSELRDKPDARYVRISGPEFTARFGTKIQLWHTGVSKLPLHEFLGLTKEEYDDFCTTGVVHLTPRFALQHLGTEWGRWCCKDTWIDYALRVARRLQARIYFPEQPDPQGYIDRFGLVSLNRYPDLPKDIRGVVIPDCSFLNEVKAIRHVGGKLIKLVRPNAGLSGDAARHLSEKEQDRIPDSEFDFIINNDGSIDDLFSKVRYAYAVLSA